MTKLYLTTADRCLVEFAALVGRLLVVENPFFSSRVRTPSVVVVVAVVVDFSAVNWTGGRVTV